ncbi:hypothetical protein V5O48_002631 [Marasmius crinis-equi]|uniref:Uncharacterized protein n=1 Tax=Marasmius crinis-equi TaxID=585013 RepID=A0ABR3FVU6_9AGAR
MPSITHRLRQLDYIRPNLRVLELEHCWAPNSTGPSLNISFPRLRLLIISSTFVGVTSLVPHLTFPATTNVRVTSSNISDSDFHVLVSWVAQCFSGSSSKKRRMEDLELSLRKNGLAGIMLSTWPDSSGERHGRESSQFSLKLRVGDTTNSQESRIARLLSVLPLGELQRLTYCFPSNEPRSLLRSFQALPNLHTIQPVGEDFFKKTLDVLTENQDSGRQTSVVSLSLYVSDMVVTFPALRRIVLESLNFPRGLRSRFWQPDLWPGRFVEALRARSNRGAPLPTVVLKNCVDVDTKHIEELRGSNIEVSIVD